MHRRLCQVLDKNVDENLCHLSNLRPRVGRYHRSQGRCDNHQPRVLRNQGCSKSYGIWEEQCLLSISSNFFTMLNSDTLLSLSLVQVC